MLFNFPGTRFVSKILNYLILFLAFSGLFAFLTGLLTRFVRDTTATSRLIGVFCGILCGVLFSALYATSFDSIFRVSSEAVSTILILGIVWNVIIVLFIYKVLGR